MITDAGPWRVARTGASIAQGVEGTLTQSERRWPEIREALVELSVVLDDWYESAQDGNRAA